MPQAEIRIIIITVLQFTGGASAKERRWMVKNFISWSVFLSFLSSSPPGPSYGPQNDIAWPYFDGTHMLAM